MASTTADILLDRLIGWGVDTVFGFPGDGINGIFESLRTRKNKLRFVQVRHEEAAAFAACGYAKFTGRLGVCLATSGPGGIHLLNGLYDAKMDRQAVLAITGHTFHDLIGCDFQQDVDLIKLYQDVAVYNERVTGPAHVVNVLDMAIKAALSRRGVAHLCIPKDVQEVTAADDPRSEWNIKGHSADELADAAPVPAGDLLRAAAAIINGGKKVAILVGRGALGCRAEVEQLAERAAGPVVKALLGKAVVPDDSPYTTGGLGLLGTAPSQDAMRECDTLVMIGTAFPYVQFLPEPGRAKCVQIDIDPARIGLRYPADVGLVGYCRPVLQALLPLVQPRTSRAFLESAQERMRDWNALLETHGTSPEHPMKPQVVARVVNTFLPDNAIVCSDCGTVTTWAARYLKMRGDMMFSASGLLATMGNGLPYAVAAAVAYPGRAVVAMCGDGGFTMTMMELATIAKYKLPVKVFIIKNNTLGQIKWEQIVFEGNPEYGCDLHPVDFARYAEAVGIKGFTLERAADAERVIGEAFRTDGPALVDCVVDANEPPMPGHVTTKQATQFAKALVRGEKDRWDIIKTVLKDKIREVI
ncbi:thiamine pyrophosphate-dependent enzyme [Frigoriglobus tundricola]|uniref:Pyruvate dehydrogenase (Quinone) n=1 Tax=Frigoriglobus tundricola TaxID=2774151 RepID=A0A6M5YI01_9BACT|nr:thiamine pyrophosphate-dependent enzyme [Frigoriglobus tundricola]QJW93164.1 Pyruvate dehydrogenase (quinone) [Frigoriglobus tundricola]